MNDACFAFIGFWECWLLGDVDDDEIEMLANLGNIVGVIKADTLHFQTISLDFVGI